MVSVNIMAQIREILPIIMPFTYISLLTTFFHITLINPFKEKVIRHP